MSNPVNDGKRLFNPSRLKLARIRRKLTLKELAEKMGLSSRIVIEYEKPYCLYEPTPETVQAYASALKYPESFFFGDDVEAIDPLTVSFRSLRTTKAIDQHAAIGAGGLGVMLSEYFSTCFTLPRPELPNLRGSESEVAAQVVREAWGIGKKSITNVVHLLEKHGVKVFWLSEETASIDAFSFWKDNVPYIFLNTRKSGERSRFDAAHELAHLVLHRQGDVKGQDAEREADAFASAFLMPPENVMAVKMAFPTFDKIVKLKSLWKVSAMALIVRMRNLNVLTEWQYNSLMRDATSKGYRTGEPGGIERERSLIIEKIMAALAGKGIHLTQLSDALNVPVDELSSLLYGVAAIRGGNSGTSLSKASLRLV